MQHKVYAEVQQYTVSKQAYRFFQAIQDQRSATGSLFQPVTGEIPNNFVQQSGTPLTINGFFHAGGVNSKHIIIRQLDVPPNTYKFPSATDSLIVPKNCINLYPNSTTKRPAIWAD
jgi:hypothetical protein